MTKSTLILPNVDKMVIILRDHSNQIKDSLWTVYENEHSGILIRGIYCRLKVHIHTHTPLFFYTCIST